ncbi:MULTISPECIES: DUF943 family protein [Erwinia]|uniref:Membrane protein n=1 Tax=Erwinia rhapontici TaxID=55212 RepID=A0ABM7MUQ5_ERWRD|nr:DUF943 family protein [Erwinia rhapontici]BCQ32892.1 membrane protein [Erwinia rhapontici]BCQ42736.1 membrane protein [Erwinia rhapontici]
MKAKTKMAFYTLLFVSGLLLGYLYWLSMRPVEIIAIHNRGSHFNSVIVKNFPFTDRGKIAWWLKNKEILKGKYNIPNPDPDGTFYLTFWLFGDGYKEEGKYDRLCFEDMKTKKNCIEKDIVFSVDNSRNMGTMFEAYDGTYRLQKNGEVVKYVDHYEVW